MNKITIQVPEKLFAEIRDLAQHREWSLAEAYYRGAELLLESCAQGSSLASQPWKPPTSRRAGWKGFTAGQLRDLAYDDHTRDPLVP